MSKEAVHGSTIYVARLYRNGKQALAKPCSSCQKLIVAAGIKRVVYSTKEGYERRDV